MDTPPDTLTSFASSLLPPRGEREDPSEGRESFLGVWASVRLSLRQSVTYASELVFCRKETTGTPLTLQSPEGTQ